MAVKRRVNKAKEQLTDAQWRYLTDQPMPANFETFVLEAEDLFPSGHAGRRRDMRHETGLRICPFQTSET